MAGTLAAKNAELLAGLDMPGLSGGKVTNE
jgi:hypothetical protein